MAKLSTTIKLGGCDYIIVRHYLIYNFKIDKWIVSLNLIGIKMSVF